MIKTKVFKATVSDIEADLNAFVEELGSGIISFDIVPDTTGAGLVAVAVLS